MRDRIVENPRTSFDISDLIRLCLSTQRDIYWDRLALLIKLKELNIIHLNTEPRPLGFDPPLVAVTADDIRKCLMKED